MTSRTIVVPLRSEKRISCRQPPAFATQSASIDARSTATVRCSRWAEACKWIDGIADTDRIAPGFNGRRDRPIGMPLRVA
jgi:hypothetical protein